VFEVKTCEYKPRLMLGDEELPIRPMDKSPASFTRFQSQLKK
jgi:hypothetical protein